MTAYSLDLREKVISAMAEADSSVRKVAKRFRVGKNFVQNMVNLKRTQGNLMPRKQGGSMESPVLQYKDQLLAIVEKQPDATLAEYCELLADETGLLVSPSTMCRTFQRLNLPRKKNASRQCRPKRAGSTLETGVLEPSRSH